jgi:hypothetical protein
VAATIPRHDVVIGRLDRRRGSRGCITAGFVVLLALVTPPLAAAPPTPPRLFMSRPAVDQSTGEIHFALGAVRLGSRAVVQRVQTDLDTAEIPARIEPLQPPASPTTAGSATDWRPSLVVGIIFFWGEGAPPEILFGVPDLFKRLPSATTVYPLPYGHDYREFLTPSTAAEIAGGALESTVKFVGGQPAFMDGLNYLRGEILKEQADLHFLIVVTDGRDRVLGVNREAFFRQGRDLLNHGVIVDVVAFPDPAEGMTHLPNAEGLAAGAEGRLVVAKNIAELPAVIENAAVIVSDLQRVTLRPGRRMWGDQATLRINAMVDDLAATASVRVSMVRTQALWWSLLGLLVVGLVTAAWLYLRRPAGGGNQTEAMLIESQRLIRLGSPPDRILVELSRRFPRQVRQLGKVDPGRLDRGKFPHLRTRAGRDLLAEIQRALATADQGNDGQPDLVAQLAAAVAADLPAAEAVIRLRARLPDKVWGAFARNTFREITHMLRLAAATHPGLATPRARQLVLQIQDALCQERADKATAAWLVRAAGPGRRGETLRLAHGRTSIGGAAGCQVILKGDPSVQPEHVTIVEDAGHFSISPGSGMVNVEGERLEGERRLTDGETLEIGAGAFVFKSVAIG